MRNEKYAKILLALIIITSVSFGTIVGAIAYQGIAQLIGFNTTVAVYTQCSSFINYKLTHSTTLQKIAFIGATFTSICLLFAFIILILERKAINSPKPKNQSLLNQTIQAVVVQGEYMHTIPYNKLILLYMLYSLGILGNVMHFGLMLNIFICQIQCNIQPTTPIIVIFSLSLFCLLGMLASWITIQILRYNLHQNMQKIQQKQNIIKEPNQNNNNSIQVVEQVINKLQSNKQKVQNINTNNDNNNNNNRNVGDQRYYITNMNMNSGNPLNNNKQLDQPLLNKKQVQIQMQPLQQNTTIPPTTIIDNNNITNHNTSGNNPIISTNNTNPTPPTKIMDNNTNSNNNGNGNGDGNGNANGNGNGNNIAMDAKNSTTADNNTNVPNSNTIQNIPINNTNIIPKSTNKILSNSNTSTNGNGNGHGNSNKNIVNASTNSIPKQSNNIPNINNNNKVPQPISTIVTKPTTNPINTNSYANVNPNTNTIGINGKPIVIATVNPINTSNNILDQPAQPVQFILSQPNNINPITNNTKQQQQQQQQQQPQQQVTANPSVMQQSIQPPQQIYQPTQQQQQPVYAQQPIYAQQPVYAQSTPKDGNYEGSGIRNIIPIVQGNQKVVIMKLAQPPRQPEFMSSKKQQNTKQQTKKKKRSSKSRSKSRQNNSKSPGEIKNQILLQQQIQLQQQQQQFQMQIQQQQQMLIMQLQQQLHQSQIKIRQSTNSPYSGRKPNNQQYIVPVVEGTRRRTSSISASPIHKSSIKYKNIQPQQQYSQQYNNKQYKVINSPVIKIQRQTQISNKGNQSNWPQSSNRTNRNLQQEYQLNQSGNTAQKYINHSIVLSRQDQSQKYYRNNINNQHKSKYNKNNPTQIRSNTSNNQYFKSVKASQLQQKSSDQIRNLLALGFNSNQSTYKKKTSSDENFQEEERKFYQSISSKTQRQYVQERDASDNSKINLHKNLKKDIQHKNEETTERYYNTKQIKTNKPKKKSLGISLIDYIRNKYSD